MEGIITAWGKILRGYRPALSVEITRECPLRCPGCYAYGDDHLGGSVTLRQVSDYKGDELVSRFFKLIEEHRPIHVSIVGGEPLVRYRELNQILPRLADDGIYAQVVTSAVRPVPIEWAALRRFQIVVSIDGLQPEHDERRKPATYDRILKHIRGHKVTVHCTVTRQQAQRDGYLEEFVHYWSANPDTHQIWVSLYTPQIGEVSDERLQPADRERVVDHTDAFAFALPQAVDAARAHLGAGQATSIAGRVHLRADDDLRFGGFHPRNLAVPVRWKAGLRKLRLHCIGRARCCRPSPPAWRAARGGDFRAVSTCGRHRAPHADARNLLIYFHFDANSAEDQP